MARKSRREHLTPELTPLIDVVFLLLIFFMVSSVFKKEELALLLSLPKTETGQSDVSSQQKFITIELSKTELALDGKIIEFEDSGIVSFDFCNGGSGILNYSTSVWQKNLESSIKIIAEKGSIIIGGQYMEKIEYCNIHNYEIPKFRLTYRVFRNFILSWGQFEGKCIPNGECYRYG